jgi:hypothetical protein
VSIILVSLLLPYDGGMASEPHLSTLRQLILAPLMAELEMCPHTRARGDDPSPREALRTGELSGLATPPAPDTFGCTALGLALAQPRDAAVRGLLAEGQSLVSALAEPIYEQTVTQSPAEITSVDGSDLGASQRRSMLRVSLS